MARLRRSQNIRPAVSSPFHIEPNDKDDGDGESLISLEATAKRSRAYRGMGNRNGTQRHEEIVRMCEQVEGGNPDQLPDTLTGDDMRLVQRVWTDVASDVDQDVAIDIFKSILSKSEDVRNLFGVSESDYNNLDTSGRYVSHARLVKNALTIFVKDLNGTVETSRIVSTLRSLGARHVSIRKEGFQPDFWYIFAVSMIEVTRAWPVPKWQRSRFERIWRELVCFVIVNMRRGYEQELTKAQYLRSPTSSAEQ